MYKIEKIYIRNLTDDGLKYLYILNKSIIEKYHLCLNLVEYQDYKKYLFSLYNENFTNLYILKKGSMPIAMIDFRNAADWSGVEHKKMRIQMGDYPIDDDILQLFKIFIDKMFLRYDHLMLEVYNDEFSEVIDNYHHTVNLKSNCYTLKHDDIDIDALKKFIDKFDDTNHDITLKYLDFIPVEYMQKYCDFFMETSDDMPDCKEDGYTGYTIDCEKQEKINMHNLENNICHHCYMAFNPNNDIIGMTNVSVNMNNTTFPYQFMLGVKDSYRGRSIAKWLYAHMYIRLYEEVDFDRVLVEHHPDNIAGINVSKSVGYKFAYKNTKYFLYK